MWSNTWTNIFTNPLSDKSFTWAVLPIKESRLLNNQIVTFIECQISHQYERILHNANYWLYSDSFSKVFENFYLFLKHFKSFSLFFKHELIRKEHKSLDMMKQMQHFGNISYCRLLKVCTKMYSIMLYYQSLQVVIYFHIFTICSDTIILHLPVVNHVLNNLDED